MKSLIVSALVAVSLAAHVSAQTKGKQETSKPPDPHAGHAAHAAREPETAAHKYFSDVELVDQTGRKLRFYSDVLKGKTVIVNAFFTTCTGVCPPMNRNLQKVQDAFGERIGKDIFIVSISVDPANDTPERLKEYAARFRARTGWTFLTGAKENVDWALYKMGQYVESRDDHKTLFIIGNEATGLWKKAFGMANHDELIEIVRSVADDRGEASSVK